MLYFSYVAISGENPIIDYTLGLPAQLTYLMGVFGVWGMVLTVVFSAVIVTVIGVIIQKSKNKAGW